MKIALFTNSYLPYLSGVSLSVHQLKLELEKSGHQVLVVAPSYPNHADSDENILRLSSLPASYPGYRFVLPFSLRLSKRLQQEKVDLIHVHQPFGVGLAARYFAQKLNLPLVYSFHTLFSRYVHNIPFLPSKISRSIVSSYLTWFCNQADQIIVPSQMVRRLLVLRQVKTQIEVIPSGIDFSLVEKALATKEYSLDIKKRHQLPADAQILLYSGRISQEKNLSFLLEAFEKISANNKNVFLILVGGGPEQKKYQQATQKSDSRIIFTGQKDQFELFSYYLAADIFVFSSLSETQGMVLAEAKAFGLPVVALFGGGIVDVVNSGLDGYVLPRSLSLFIEHVERLLADQTLRKKMSEKAKLDARARFASNVIAKKIETLYNAVVNQRRFS